MQKKRIVRKMEDISAEVMELIMKKYPDGWNNHVVKVPKPNGDFFHAITVDTDEASYLIKVKVKVDSKSELEKEEQKREKEQLRQDENDDNEVFDDEKEYE